ncbi:hypothetical protein [Bradyrhizobium sp. JYMT SZCCT0428]|uniref:hypothetical protein n=1 Tax=Bradyrhizobium sp. JYMT SZCCT0428 TaxID=2807673 RepID=UPI001BA4AC30|nr:hypothetical protein [Bradyrhizobium sp. JYMT SZCCT0428]MBR1155811.1 hypothetical protein [Bradyrhizobium sp. JYMT SZCCT0428]
MNRLGNVLEFWRCHGSWRAVNTPAPNDIFLNGNTRQRVINSSQRCAMPVSRPLTTFSISIFAKLRR